MGVRPTFEVPDGWVARGCVVEVETTSPEQPGQIAQAFGARRHAYNRALGQVKANRDARIADPTVPPLAWNFYELRKAWNQAKDEVAPWWRCTSKEAYASGIADLVAGLHNWSDAKAGRRKGALVVNGRARILSMTLSQRGGRLVVAVQAIVAQQPRHQAEPDGAAASTLASAPSGRSSPRTVSQAGIGRIRPTLSYKCPTVGRQAVVGPMVRGLQVSSWLRRLPG